MVSSCWDNAVLYSKRIINVPIERLDKGRRKAAKEDQQEMMEDDDRPGFCVAVVLLARLKISIPTGWPQTGMK